MKYLTKNADHFTALGVPFVEQFLKLSNELQEVAKCQIQIWRDSTSDEQERSMALHTLIELLLPVKENDQAEFIRCSLNTVLVIADIYTGVNK